MKQFQVYGIGNALVDIDFEVSLDTLRRLSIDKGVMTLIDEATHYRLLEEIPKVGGKRQTGDVADFPRRYIGRAEPDHFAGYGPI